MPTGEIAPGRVLVVDDLENMCWILSKLLTERGHLVRSAGSRASALRLLDDFDCQVAVVDYRLPDSNGIALIDEMVARRPKLKAILMTSYGNVALRDQAAAKSVFYFDKPFENDLMIATIESCIQASQKMGDRPIEDIP